MVGRGGGVAYGDNGGEGHYQRDHRAVGRGGVAYGDNGGDGEVERNCLVALVQRSVIGLHLKVPLLQQLLILLCL